MLDFKIPSDGLTVLHDRLTSNGNTTKELSQIIQLNLVENVTKDVLRSIRNNEQVRLKLGKNPTIQCGQYGRKQLNHVSSPFPSEIFLGPLDGSEPMYFSGKISHTLEVQQARQDTVGSDEALANLKNTIKSMKEQQASNEASFMGSKNERKKREVRPPPLSRDRLLGTTTPSSPFLGTSPRLGPTSNPLLSPAPTKEKIRQDAMRIPLVHLLAINPMTPKALADKLNASQSDCDRVLEKIAKDTSNGGTKELKEKSFRELDVWKFPYPTDEDRQAAIEHAIHAYDRMRIDKQDQIWQLLLPVEERGKRKYLSRLNFAPLAPTPKVGIEGKGKAEASDKEGKVKKSTEPQHKKKLSGDTLVKKKVERGPVKANIQPAKVDGKFKSSERIENSDEEAEGVEVVPAKPRVPRMREREPKTAPSPKSTTSIPANSQHKSSLSNASSGSSDLDKTRFHEDRTKLKPRVKQERSPSTSRISPRPRVDSSPQKPSPLGSSPPTNSTDLENSSKSSTQSSAPSSPPSSTDMPLSQARKDYSPVIAGKNRTVARNVPKRKAEKITEPPPKRQQIGLGLSKTSTDRLQQPTPERRPSDSSVSSPEKPAVTKESVVDATLRFRDYYARYKDLHDRLARQEPDERSDRELDQLRKMHERLEKFKSDLWSDWAKAGGEMPI